MQLEPTEVPMRHALLGTLALAGLLLSGCSSFADLQNPRANAAPTPSAEAVAATRMATQIDTLQRLVQGSPAEQAEIVSAARRDYDLGHQAPAALRFALVLSAPGHDARDPHLAQRLLREALATPERLTPPERGLAVVELGRVDAELRLLDENLRLADEAERERNKDHTPAANNVAVKRLQAEMEENAKLRRALDEARVKLDAIANIESKITTRKSPQEKPTP